MSATGRARPIAAMAAALTWLGVASGAPAWGGEPMPRPVLIGALTSSWGPTPGADALGRALQHLGYAENEDFVLGVRFTRGDPAGMEAAASQLVRDGADIVLADDMPAAIAASRAILRTPMVFLNCDDPVKYGLAESWSRPGGTSTGIASNYVTLSRKRLEMIHQMVPGVRRVLWPYYPSEEWDASVLEGTSRAARSLAIELQPQPLHSEAEAEAYFASLRPGDWDGMLVAGAPHLNIPGFALEASGRLRLPVMIEASWYVERGGLASYGTSYAASGHMGARLVAKIMEGADPAEIPVELNNDIEFVVNLKTARALGIEIPPEVLFQADRIIR